MNEDGKIKKLAAAIYANLICSVIHDNEINPKTGTGFNWNDFIEISIEAAFNFEDKFNKKLHKVITKYSKAR